MGQLQDELRKKHPFECLEQEAVLNLFRTNNRVELRFARLFARHGLTGAQYNVLRILRGEGGPLPCLEIAQRTIVEVPGITGLIDRLERAGLVNRTRRQDDRRVIEVDITERGRAILAEIDAPILDLHRQVLAHLSTEEVVELNRLLEKVRLGEAAPNRTTDEG